MLCRERINSLRQPENWAENTLLQDERNRKIKFPEIVFFNELAQCFVLVNRKYLVTPMVFNAMSQLKVERM